MIKNGDVRRLLDARNFLIWSESPNDKYRINTAAFCEKVGQAVVIQAFKHSRCKGKKAKVMSPRVDTKSVTVILLLCAGKMKSDTEPLVISVRSLKKLRKILDDLAHGAYKVLAAA